jgi:hypothetical protein
MKKFILRPLSLSASALDAEEIFEKASLSRIFCHIFAASIGGALILRAEIIPFNLIQVVLA